MESVVELGRIRLGVWFVAWNTLSVRKDDVPVCTGAKKPAKYLVIVLSIVIDEGGGDDYPPL